MTDRAVWQTARNILCIRLDTLGDVLMTTPAIRGLKQAAAGQPVHRRHITLLTSPAGAAAARLVPEIDEVMTYDAPWMKATAPRADAAPDFAMIEALRARRFDAAVIFTVYSQNPLPAAMLCYLAGIPLRLAHCHENPYQMLTDWVRDPEPAQVVRHEVQRQLDLVAAVGAAPRDRHLSLRVPRGAEAAVTHLLAECGLDPARPWVLIHPGASAPSRRYPPESFAVVAEKLQHELGVQVVFTGVESEIPLVEEIRGQARADSLSLAGRLNLGQMAALIRMAPLLISNNTGPVHMAAALGTPVVVLYALTNPQHTPWEVASRVLSHDVPCKYCYKSVCPLGHGNCLRLVAPDEVVGAAAELLRVGAAGGLQQEAPA